MLRLLLDGGSMIPAVGASGAICGLLGAYGYVFRRERTDFVIGPWWFDLWRVECSVLTTVIVFFLGQIGMLLLFTAAGISTGVGYGAHVVGLLVGLGAGIVISKRREAMLASWRREHAPDIPCPTCAGEARFAVDDLYRCRACGKWTHGPRPEEATG
jgi:membrane associated rhomboid family serine protease